MDILMTSGGVIGLHDTPIQTHNQVCIWSQAVGLGIIDGENDDGVVVIGEVGKVVVMLIKIKV